MTVDYRVISLEKPREHQTESGGYDRLARELGAESVRRFPKSRWPGPALARHWWRRWARQRGLRQYFFDYRYEDWQAERAVMASVRRDLAAVVHVLYGDSGMDVLMRRRDLLRCPLVATFHSPRHRPRVQRRFQDCHDQLRSGVDAAIAVARSQIPELQRWLKSDRVFYVPHGIDVRRFVPGDRTSQPPELRLLTVGNYHRDFDALRWIALECNARGLSLRFDCVVPGHEGKTLAGLPAVRLLQGISEAALIRLYQEADALLLPLRDATANNAILESLACGTPVISNSVGGVPDYVDNASGWLFAPGEVDGMIELIETMCRRREIAASKRAAARNRALEFDWSSVVSQTRSVYEAARCNWAGVDASRDNGKATGGLEVVADR